MMVSHLYCFHECHFAECRGVILVVLVREAGGAPRRDGRFRSQFRRSSLLRAHRGRKSSQEGEQRAGDNLIKPFPS
jgi:hypothetical protein